MWCTRWFLPLLLLPVPTAPPYFLFLFIISLTLHARPCMYCIMLLSALFGSSCYWQPLATDYLLQRHPSLVPPPEVASRLPPLVSLPDRCWCDMSGSLFNPFNTTLWEQRALYLVLRPAIDGYKKEIKAKEDAEAAEAVEVHALQDTKQSEHGAIDVHRDCEPEPLPWYLQGPLARFIVDRLLEPRCKVSQSTSNTSSFVLDVKEPTEDQASASSSPAPSVGLGTIQHIDASSRTNATQSRPLPWLRRKYDLTPYGVGLIFDFGLGPDSKSKS